jgi:hypothetical protein
MPFRNSLFVQFSQASGSMKVDGRSVPKRWHLNYRRRGITQKKAYDKNNWLCFCINFEYLLRFGWISRVPFFWTQTLPHDITRTRHCYETSGFDYSVKNAIFQKKNPWLHRWRIVRVRLGKYSVHKMSNVFAYIPCVKGIRPYYFNRW